MDAQEIVKRLMKQKGYTIQLVSEKLGAKHRSNVSERLRGRNIRTDSLVRILSAMDCELVIRSKTAVAREDDPTRTYKPEYIVELDNEE